MKESCYFYTKLFTYKYFDAKMATFTPLYKIRIFNFEDVMREMKLSHAGTLQPLKPGSLQV